MEIYFQATLNDVHIARGFCESIESLPFSTCNEVCFWNGDNFIALSGVGLVVKYRYQHECIVEDGHILQDGENVNKETFLVL